MVRCLRLSFENVVYHITARGNRGEDIFYSDKDKEVFVDKMNETFTKKGKQCQMLRPDLLLFYFTHLSWCLCALVAE